MNESMTEFKQTSLGGMEEGGNLGKKKHMSRKQKLESLFICPNQVWFWEGIVVMEISRIGSFMP
jgi:hypothetical protein